ncbi:hypothetical protein FRC02_001122 [Tulasnella sp. 418]|nr:hypothetical protein FRC02_001122 [Tulasnella sp. 418]
MHSMPVLLDHAHDTISLNLQQEHSSSHLAMSDSHLLITGPAVFDPFRQDDPPSRLAIEDLIEDQLQFSLFIQALAKMMAEPQDQLIAHYQVGGIHGLPPVKWNGSGGDDSVSDNWKGYCTHSTNIFPTWHRPYVALYEQVLQQYAIEKANEYQQQPAGKTWVAIAEALRLPYWDWAAKAIPPDEVINQDHIDIVTPDDKLNPDGSWTTTSVVNPLWGYHFTPPLDKSFSDYDYFANWLKTLRHPTSADASATDNPDSLKRTLKLFATQFRNQTHDMLLLIDNWYDFSNDQASKHDHNAYTSLEGIHDSVHNCTGGDPTTNVSGHMAWLEFAGHDPIFFMHHCNVDRLFALWQAINPTIYVTPGDLPHGSWTYPASNQNVVDETTALTPFWQTQEIYWDSVASRDFRRLGYTYPEFQNVGTTDPDALSQIIKDKVAQLYPRERIVPPRAPGHQLPNYREWLARVRAKKHGVGGGFSVYLFFGHVPDNRNEWLESPSFAGAQHFFVTRDVSNCSNCQSQADIDVEAFIYFTEAINRVKPELFPFEVDEVEPWLTEEKLLHWRVIRHSDSTIVNSDDPKLELQVVVLSRPHDQVARHHPAPNRGIEVHHGITVGRPGGARSG